MSSKRALEAYKACPKFTSIDGEDINDRVKVACTENTIGARIDIIIDQDNDYVGLRVNGKSRGDTYKLWSSHVRKNYDLDLIKKDTPIPLGIITLVGIASLNISKVISAVTYDAETKVAKFINWDWLEDLCGVIGMNRMPEVYSGPAKASQLRAIASTDYMDLPKDGMIMITRSPVRYILFGNSREEGEVSEDPVAAPKEDLSLSKSLADEFSNLAVEEEYIIDNSLNLDESAIFIDVMRKAKKENLLGSYIKRCIEEAHVTADVAESLCKLSLRIRITNLIKEYGGKEV